MHPDGKTLDNRRGNHKQIVRKGPANGPGKEGENRRNAAEGLRPGPIISLRGRGKGVGYGHEFEQAMES